MRKWTVKVIGSKDTLEESLMESECSMRKLGRHSVYSSAQKSMQGAVKKCHVLIPDCHIGTGFYCHQKWVFPPKALGLHWNKKSIFHTFPTLTLMETNAGENSFCCHLRAGVLKGIWDKTKHSLSPNLSLSQGCACHRESVSQGQVITMLW